MTNLFGSLVYSSQIKRTITNGTHSLFGSDKFLNYDRTDGNIILNLPKLSTFLESNSKSGNTLSLNYLLSDLTSGVSANTLTLNCDASDNINNVASIVVSSNTSYSLQATPSGWLLVNQIGTQSKGIFNNTGSSFSSQDFTNQNLGQYTQVITASCILELNYIIDGSSTLKYFTASGVSVTQTVALTNCSGLVGMEMYDCSVLTSLDLSNNILLDTVSVLPNGIGATNPLNSVNIDNCPLLKTLNLNKNSLTTLVVDYILATLDANGLSGGTIVLNAGANSAPTGGAGNANVLSLQGKGWSVAHN